MTTNNSPNQDKQEPVIERELKNDTVDDTAAAVGTLEDDLNQIAEHTDAEYVLVRMEPLTKEQHESNEALRQLVSDRSSTDD